jgi:multiple sugar transport system permease protein
MSIYIYESFLRRGEIGKAMAAAILLFLTAFLLLAIGQRLTQKRAE